MLGTGMGAKALEMLLMKMSIRGSTTSSLQDKRYCSLLYMLAAAVGGRARPGGLRVLRTLSAVMDAYGLVVPH